METVGCGATSRTGSCLMSVYRSFTSTGTKLMLTAAGPAVVCQQKRSGRWRLVRSHIQKRVLRLASARFPGAMTRPHLIGQILIGVRWDAFQLTHCRQVIARSAAAK